jgi:hypothetical protein
MLGLLCFFPHHVASAAETVVLEPHRLVVTAPTYRATFHRWQCEMQLELRDGQDHWRPVTRQKIFPEFAQINAQGTHGSLGAPARLQYANVGEAIAPEPEDSGTRPVPDFPAAIRRARLVEDIRQAVVYTINETIRSDDGIGSPWTM